MSHISRAHASTEAPTAIYPLRTETVRGPKKIPLCTARFEINLPRMTQDEVIQVFRKSGALLEGHFILRSGLHSRQFFQCALALQHMPDVEKLGAALADKLRGLGAVTV